MPNVLPRLIRIQFLQTTEVAPARIRVDDGENKMTEAYGYDNMEEQSQELMRRFCVVAPSLTPESYNPIPISECQQLCCSSLSHPGKL